MREQSDVGGAEMLFAIRIFNIKSNESTAPSKLEQ